MLAALQLVTSLGLWTELKNCAYCIDRNTTLSIICASAVYYLWSS